MYKLLLCLRYLRTRFLAFVCIVSVMLGVSTLIVVNSVMSGFSNKLKDRLHGILSDVIIESERSDGFLESPEEVIARLENSEIGQYIDAAAPTVEVFALLQFTAKDFRNRPMTITKQVRLIGVDPARHARVGQFSEHLIRQKNSDTPDFELTDEAWQQFQWNRMQDDLRDQPRGPSILSDPFAAGPTEQDESEPGDFLNGPVIGPSPTPSVTLPPPDLPESEPVRLPGVILGHALAHFRYKDANTGENVERALLRPGDDVLIATVGGTSLKPVSGTFIVSDYFKSEMSEYDGSFVYVPLVALQQLRGMDGKANMIQVKLTEDVRHDSAFVHDVIVPELRKLFPPGEARIESWQQHQGPLLAAIDIERGILNLLLFMIVGVAGFSVLAIFTMIVSEKYRDIGILKSLGASDRGVMFIFMQ